MQQRDDEKVLQWAQAARNREGDSLAHIDSECWLRFRGIETATNVVGVTVLDVAIAKNQFENVRDLVLNAGLSVTPTHVFKTAEIGFNEEMCLFLFDNLRPKVFTREGQSLLHLACQSRLPTLAKRLIEDHGCSVFDTDKKGRCALDIAAFGGTNRALERYKEKPLLFLYEIISFHNNTVRPVE